MSCPWRDNRATVPILLSICAPYQETHAKSCTPLDISSRRQQASAEAWQTRLDLAAAYRLVVLFKWDDLVFTHISARVPGTENEFLISRYGLMFDEIAASSLVKIDIHGNKWDDSPFPVNPAGFTIHSAVHAMRHDAPCVLPISQQSIFVLGNIGHHDHDGVALRDDEKPRLVRDLGQNTIRMLRNHGLFNLEPSIVEAFCRCICSRRSALSRSGPRAAERWLRYARRSLPLRASSQPRPHAAWVVRWCGQACCGAWPGSRRGMTSQ